MAQRGGREGLPDDATARRKALGKLLREARQAREEILSKVAAAAGVSTPFLSDLERGERTIGPKRLDALACALGLKGEAYVRVFQLRGRLPPRVEARLIQHPELWQEKGRDA